MFISSNTMFDRLFGQYKPLSSFSAKIEIALAIGVIDKRIHANLNLIRLIRNDFAHEVSPLRFQAPRRFKWVA